MLTVPILIKEPGRSFFPLFSVSFEEWTKANIWLNYFLKISTYLFLKKFM